MLSLWVEEGMGCSHTGLGRCGGPTTCSWRPLVGGGACPARIPSLACRCLQGGGHAGANVAIAAAVTALAGGEGAVPRRALLVP